MATIYKLGLAYLTRRGTVVITAARYHVCYSYHVCTSDHVVFNLELVIGADKKH